MNDGIIFTGMSMKLALARPAGAVRIRTWLEDHNYNIEVIDYFNNFTNDDIVILCSKYISIQTVIVGVSITFFNDVEKINFLFKHIKENYPAVKTIIGGTEADTKNLDTSLVDGFIWGYAEEAILHYLDFLKGKRLDNLLWVPYKNSVAIDAEMKYKNDDSDLTIRWKDSDMLSTNYLPIEISRGCIFKCRFCQYPLLGKKKNDYIRHCDNLIDELRRNYEQWGITNYSFQDDTFNDNVVKLDHVANAIAKSGVKITYSAFLRADLLAAFPETIPMLVDTGIIAAGFGIESLNEKSRIAIGKGGELGRQFEAIKTLKQHRAIWSFTGMITGLPFEPIASFYESQQWLEDQDGEIFDTWQWFPLGIRGTAMTRRSEFEKNHTFWKYQLEENGGIYSNWKSPLMDLKQAYTTANELNQKTFEYRVKKNLPDSWRQDGSTSAFEIAELVGLGFDISDIVNKRFDKLMYTAAVLKMEKIINDYKEYHLT